MNNIGRIQLYGKKNYDEALHYHQQALTMLEGSYSLYYGDIAMTLDYIGDIFYEQNKDDHSENKKGVLQNLFRDSAVG